MDAPPPPPLRNPFNRPAAILTAVTAACIAAAFLGQRLPGMASIAVSAVSGTIGFCLAFGAIAAHVYAARFDDELAAIARGEALADWTFPAAEWNRFVEAWHAEHASDARERRYHGPSDGPVRVVLMPRSVYSQDQHAIWGTATQTLTAARVDEARRRIVITVVAVTAEVVDTRTHEWPVPEGEIERAKGAIAAVAASR